MEILDWQLTDYSETEQHSQLSATAVVCPVEVGTVNRAGYIIREGSLGEPRFKL